ncbi:MAG: hypothetical protein IPH18_11870 [Chitinophagaceae bacterium]|nr:hypothetical protein [Chitinophagaceae bacterium]
MKEVKAIVLCNNPIAIPGIKEFLFYGKLAAICIPRRNKEMQHILEHLLTDTGVPLLLLNKKDYVTQLTDAIHQYQPNAGLIMTFPYILPDAIINMPEKGFINFHYGLLPSCRGPQPILWHMLKNDTEAGITLHKVDEGIDTGAIIIQEKIPIEQADTYGTLQTKLAYLAAKQAEALLKILLYGTIIPSQPQDESMAAYYKMPEAKDLTINWKKMSAEEIVRLCNACNPWNKGAGTSINNWVMGVTSAEDNGEYLPLDEKSGGTIIACSKEEGLVIKTADNRRLIITIVYINEGFFTGWQLLNFGIKEGMILGE